MAIDVAVLTFVALPVVLVTLVAWAVGYAWRRDGKSSVQARRAVLATLVGSALWMAFTWTLAARGVLVQWDRRPPPFALLVVAIMGLACALAFTRVGWRLARHVPLAALIGVQAFRWPLELSMHEMAVRGVAPEQMTYTGRNWDIVTGLSAALVALLVAAGRGGRRMVTVWNIAGLLLVVNVVTVGIASTPAFAAFGPERLNVWVMTTPFVWLPAVMVLIAFAGHFVIFRRLRMDAAEPRDAVAPAIAVTSTSARQPFY